MGNRENARKLRSIYFVVPEDEEYTEITKHASRKLQVRVDAGVPCKKKQQQKARPAARKLERGDMHPTRFQNRSVHVSWGLVNPLDNFLEPSLPKDHEDHVAGKGNNTMAHYNELHKFVLMPQATKLRMRRQQWTRNGRSLVPAWRLDRVKSKKEVLQK